MAEKEKEMSFLGHLEELRWHLVRSASVVLIFGIFLFIFQKEVYENFLLAHRKSDFITYQLFCDFFNLFGLDSSFCRVSFKDNLISLKPTQQLMNSIWSSFILGIILSFPYLLWELWKFISPGLTLKEVRNSKGFIFAASLLFFLGIAFSFSVVEVRNSSSSPFIIGIATPDAAASGPRTSVVLSPTPPVEYFSILGRETSIISITSPESIISSVKFAISCADIP